MGHISGGGQPYAGLEELSKFAMACDGRSQWTAYGMAVLSVTCLLRVGEAAPIRPGGSRARGLGFHTTPLSVTHTSSQEGGELWHDMAATVGPRGIHICGPTGTLLLPTRGGLPPNAHGDRP